MLRNYYELAKPGMVYGNLLTAVAAYFFASRLQINAAGFFGTVFGLGLVIACACVFNNYLDRDIDKNMERTKGRALVTGEITPRAALIFGSVLGIVGFALLFLFVNVTAAIVALAGLIVYVVLYGFSKRASEWGVVVGSVAGAVPIVVGYVGAVDRLDAAALILFFTLALWQMPHFFSIATYRAPDYAAAGIPVLPLQKGMYATKVQIILYIIGFAFMASLLTIFGYAGYSYLLITGIAALAWFWFAVEGFKTNDDAKWARKLFFVSLVTLLVFCVALSVAAILP